jgi:ribonuclease J
MGLLDHNDIIADEKSLKKFDNKHVYILTGCQGDYFGALRRAADNEVKNLSIDNGDLFVFSSKAIPGNEKQIYRIYNKLTEKGAEIITARDMNVHASGHPSQEDLLELYDKIQPNIVIPIHGESYFLKKHVEFCKDNNINSRMFLNNSSLKINGSNIKQINDDKVEPKIYHSNDMELDRPAISQRRKLALNGLCLISINKSNRALNP